MESKIPLVLSLLETDILHSSVDRQLPTDTRQAANDFFSVTEKEKKSETEYIILMKICSQMQIWTFIL